MSETPHTFHVGDGSLRHRIDEYLAALEAYGNVLTSQQFADDPEWSDTLGHKEDIAEAEKVLKHSLARVTKTIDVEELREALSQGLINEEQAQKFSQLKQTQEFELFQKNKRHSQSSGQGQKL